MLDLSEHISKISEYFESGAENSALETLLEILPKFFQSLYPISQPKKPELQYLVHYTSLETLFSMLDRDNPGGLRLYDTIHSNDPTEGVFFRNHLKESDPHVYDRLPPFVTTSHPGYAYISSFVRAHNDKKQDKLVYWLAYGRNGYGCSIAVPYSTFLPKIPILPIQYGGTSVTTTAQKVGSFLNTFTPSFQQYLESNSPNNKLASVSRYFGQIPYFHKPNSYSYESECRLLLPPSHHLSDPSYQTKYDCEGVPSVRHYVEIDSLRLAKIFFTGTIITLGPSIPNRENVQSAIIALLQHHHLSGPDVVCSKIPYKPFST